MSWDENNAVHICWTVGRLKLVGGNIDRWILHLHESYKNRWALARDKFYNVMVIDEGLILCIYCNNIFYYFFSTGSKLIASFRTHTRTLIDIIGNSKSTLIRQ